MTDKAPNFTGPDLLVKIAQGDQSAVRAFLDRYGGWVSTLARCHVKNSEDVDDAVQEVFVHLWSNAHRFNPTLSSEMTFVTMLARRRLIDRRRRDDRSPPLEQIPDEFMGSEPDVSTRIELRDEAERANQALNQLDIDQRQALQLAIYHGLTHEEIARELSLPLGTVKTRLRRGLIRLRALLDEMAGSRRTASEGGAR